MDGSCSSRKARGLDDRYAQHRPQRQDNEDNGREDKNAHGNSRRPIAGTHPLKNGEKDPQHKGNKITGVAEYIVKKVFHNRSFRGL